MKMTINQILRTASGVLVVFYGIMQQGPNKNSIENAAWFFVVIFGLVLLGPAIRMIKKAIFAGNDDQIDKNKMATVWVFYFIAAFGCIAALSYQSDLNSKGKIYVGKGYSYSVSGVTAHQQIYTCLIGGIISFVIAIVLHIRVKRLSLETGKPPEIPQFVICPKCLEPLWGKDNQSMICTACQSPLENLKGFHDRHPELESRDGNTKKYV